MTFGEQELRQLARIREHLRIEVDRVDRPDLADVLDERSVVRVTGPIRVVTVGETKRGKSTLVNSLVGRPLLSPVGVDVTTSCWLEISYGDRDEAQVLLADQDAPGEPRRAPCDLREIEKFVAVSEVTDPVVGVQVRLNSPLLRDMILIDTPGVGGLLAGHSRTALAALRRADALLFVCDAQQPILRPEIDFLIEATAIVPTVVIAVTKCDQNPGFEEVVAASKARIADEPALRDAPVIPVAAPLADRAAEVEDGRRSARLLELSGMIDLVGRLKQQAAVGSAALRIANGCHVVANVARILVGRNQELLTELDAQADRERSIGADIDRLTATMEDTPGRARLVHQRLSGVQREALGRFQPAVDAIRTRYRTEAERGPAAQLTTLAPRMVADLTALGVTTLEMASEQCMVLTRRLLDELGAIGVISEMPARNPGAFVIDLAAPELSGRRAGEALGRAAGIFTTLAQLLAGSALAVSVLTGPGIVAASLALAAGAGWWQLRGESEQLRRSQLGAWVDGAATQAVLGFDVEIGRRSIAVESYVERILPELLQTRRNELRALNEELSTLRQGSVHARSHAIAAQRDRIEELRRLAGEADSILRRANTTTGMSGAWS